MNVILFPIINFNSFMIWVEKGEYLFYLLKTILVIFYYSVFIKFQRKMIVTSILRHQNLINSIHCVEHISTHRICWYYHKHCFSVEATTEISWHNTISLNNHHFLSTMHTYLRRHWKNKPWHWGKKDWSACHTLKMQLKSFTPFIFLI